MDLLASWNMDELPEQQTRMMQLMEQHPDFDLRLGFDACCTCATPFPAAVVFCEAVGAVADGSGCGKKKFSASSVAALTAAASIISCPSCRRVSYCSEACRRQDSQALTAASESGDEELEEKAMGHSSIICALLQTCQDDEDVEEDDNNDESSVDKATTLRVMDATRRQASLDRIRSEFQSYPATLANVLCDGPCYQHVLSSKASNNSSNSKVLVIHVIGASEQAELWGEASARAMLDDDNNDSANDKSVHVDKKVMIQAYAQALAELVERFKLDIVNLVLFGPDCPDSNLELSCSIPSSSSNSTRNSKGKSRDRDADNDDTSAIGQVVLKTFKGEYHDMIQNMHQHGDTSELAGTVTSAIPDVVVFFNPGFTVPDYDWRATLSAIPAGTPFLSCTNTELEGIADVQFLLDQDKVQSIPPGMAEIFGLHYEDYNDNNGDEDDDGVASFFSENPFCGTRVRQSGTMANDLFVKNRWMLGGFMDSFDPSRRSSSAAMEESPKKRKTTTTTADNSNTKATNPALI
jgi:hypothetical protein